MLAETGLLDGCDATSHWGYQDLFRRRYPQIRFRPEPNLCFADPLGRIVTAGGTTSWHDLALHIISRHVNPGEVLNGNTPVFTIVQSDPLKWTGTVAEHAALQVRSGQIVRLRADTVPGRTFDGEVIRVSPAVDVTSRTALLEARVPNRQGLLKPGLFARGVIELRQDTGVAFVPEAAISYFAGITKVFVVADGTARERTVKLGVRRDGWIEVEDGVKVGETVAASGLGQLRDGERVTVARAAVPAK